MSDLLVVFGGSGFLGRHIVRLAVRRGYRVRVAVRRPHEAEDLRPMGKVGQIDLAQCNIRYPESVAYVLRGADHMVNCVGLLFERGRQKFRHVHVEGVENIALAAKKANLLRSVHISFLLDDPDNRSIYARTKREAEKRLRAHLPQASILRPSLIFGPRDGFFNRFAAQSVILPIFPLPGGGKSLFEPVYVEDVAKAALACLERDATQSKDYQCAGPDRYDFKSLLCIMGQVTHRRAVLVPLPWPVMHVNAAIIETFFRLLPVAPPPITVDQLRLLRANSISDPAKPGLEALGIVPRPLLPTIESYLWRFRPRGEFEPEVRSQEKQAAVPAD